MTRRPSRAVAGIVALVAGAAVACGDDPGAPAAGSAGPREATEALFAAVPDDEPGCTAAVNVDGEIVWSGAYGMASLEDDEPFTTDTIVDIGSTSKQFTGAAIGLLVLDGDLAFDDTIDEHLDGLPGWAGAVTVGDLVRHTSGLPDYIELLEDEGVSTTEPADQADALATLDGTTLDFEPGSTFAYSNSNYLLLAALVEAVSGRDLAVYLDEEVFGPLGIDAEVAPGVALEGKAESYDLDGDWVDADSPWTQVGDGAVQTTAGELARWATEYWDPTLGGGALDELWLADAVESDDGGRYGLGIIEYPDGDGTVLSHGGGWAGFETSFVVDPEARVAVAMTCNSPDVEVGPDTAEQLLDIWR